MKRILLLTAILFSLSTSTVLASNWLWMFSTNTTNYYFDLDNIQDFYKNGDRVIIIWSKNTYNYSGIQKVIADREANNLDIAGFENLDNEISRFVYIYISNGDKYEKIIYSSYYDTTGQLLEKMDYTAIAKKSGVNNPPILLPPDTVGEKMANCALEISDIYKDLSAYKRNHPEAFKPLHNLHD